MVTAMGLTSGSSPPTLLILLVLQWSSVFAQAGTIFCDDPELCLSKRFLRFGRGPAGDDPFYRITRQYYRLGRGYHPYQDKRFLRFGRAQQQQQQQQQQQGGLDELFNQALLQGGELYSRKRRSLGVNSQLEHAHGHVRRSTSQSEHHEHPMTEEVPNAIKKRAADDFSAPGGAPIAKRFMRFGRSDGGDEAGVEKRFMRFGKRLFPTKRFMRFGRDNSLNNAEDDGSEGGVAGIPNKRFMRFGKRMTEEGDGSHFETGSQLEFDNVDDVISLAHKLKSQLLHKNDDFDKNKRFMRFGKSQGL